ncbi:MAG: hypothetical protein KKA07_05725 [Bacteroidetes bacterium]|nr:hypothetical protein [Bacteroidota bacterium]MBU1718553.1 hypothetical protein [Bacteroidota bacterium]
MKKIIAYSLILGTVVGIVVPSLYSCKKKEDPVYPVEIMVRFKHSDEVVEGALVSIIKNDIRIEDLVTNNRGVINYTFELPAILDVYAEFDTNTTLDNIIEPPLTGSGVVKLVEDETVEKTVYIQ